MATLEHMRSLVEEGYRAHLLQRTPHLVLLSPAFYRTKLAPVLAQWLLIWFQYKHPMRGCPDLHVLAYLTADPTLPAAALNNLQVVR
jgi:hypothetical protein